MRHSLTAALFAFLCFLSCGTPRKTVPVLTDMDLVGGYHREPIIWDAERFAPHVSFVDEDGKEQWLFQSFLFTEGHDAIRGRNLSLSPGGISAGRESWEAQLDLWLGPDGGVKALDEACAAAAGRIGKPDGKRYVILAIPDAIMFEQFADKSSSTTYWGAVDGKQLDFATAEGQIRAYRWYIDEARKRFRALHCKYLELGGFYILSEELHLPWGETPLERLNCQYKRWEEIVPAVASYCHDRGEGLWWIPYHLAPGYKYWKELGFDQAYMQPNWYWDLYYGDHPFDKTLQAIKDYGMGLELEFEYSAVFNEMPEGAQGPDGSGRMIFTRSDVPALQGRLRTYMQEFKDAGLWGVAPIALYSGSNALTQLATSPVPEDQALYRELCAFILGNRIRKNAPADEVRIIRDEVCIGVDAKDGSLQLLSHALDGHNYAGGGGLWRLYYNTPEQKEIELTPKDGRPEVSMVGDTIRIDYPQLGGKAFALHLSIWAEGGQARFAATVENNEPHTIIRELQYPLVGDLSLPEGYKLLTTHTGGQVFNDPVRKISDVDVKPLYMKPDQKFRQYDLQYPRNAASNCFAFTGEEDGLYFGSHDLSLQQTWHGLRTYPGKAHPAGWQDFNRLEAGFYRYPNITCGESWANGSSVIVPYLGDWRETSRLYRAWADTWWKHEPVPQWVQDMTGWQRIIFKHQYGEYLRHYEDLPGHIADVGESVGSDAVLAFGWWKEGMDNGYPDYTPDDSQGGDAAWKEAIRAYRDRGGHLILYFNGRLIDNESSFYRSGEASRVSNHDNTGMEFTEHYKFTGEGTTLGYYDSRTFVIADMSKRLWRDKLLQWADRAIALGANSVFYDQLGVAEEFPNWDRSGEWPVPDVYTGRYKAEALQEIRDHVKAIDPEFCLGTEWLSDCTARFCDFVHIVEFTALPESFPEWFRYTFPEVIWSDRCVRDDFDVPRRVNNTLLKGLRNDIEVFRCRGLIDETPVYQEHLAKINEIRHAYPDLLLEGRFAYMDDFTCSNPAITAREFIGGRRLAIVATSLNPGYETGRIKVPGYELRESRTVGDAQVKGNHVRLGLNGLAVLIYEKE